MSTATSLRIPPETQKPYYPASDRLSFQLPAQGFLAPETLTLQFEAALSIAGADPVDVDLLQMGALAGAWSLIDQLILLTNGNEVLSRVEGVGRWISTLNSLQHDAGEVGLIGKTGALEFSSASAATARLNCLGAKALPLQVSLDLSRAINLLSRWLPLAGGMKLQVTLSSNERALFATGANPSFQLSNVRLCGRTVIKPMMAIPKAQPFIAMSVLQNTLDTAYGSLSFKPTTIRSALGVLVSFLPTESQNSITHDSYELAAPAISSISITVGGKNYPLAYKMNFSDTSGFSEAMAQSALVLGQNVVAQGGGYFLAVDGGVETNVIGTPLGGEDLSQQEVVLTINSNAAATVGNSYIVYATFLGLENL